MATKKNPGRGKFAQGTQQLWVATKPYPWGMGFMPLVKQDEVSLRLIVKNKDEHTPKSGEEWVVEAKEWWTKEGDKDEKGRQVLYVSGTLKEREVKTEQYVDHRRNELVTTTRSGKKIVETKVSPITTQTIPCRDKENPDRIVFMEVSFADGKEAARRYSFEKSLAVWKKFYAADITETIEAVFNTAVTEEQALELLPYF